MTEQPPAPPTPPAPTPDADKSFTQADLDRIVADRVQRERGKYADYQDLKTKAGRLAEIEASQQTDLEKAVTAARAEGKTEAIQTANARLVAAEVRALAATEGFRNPVAALALLREQNKLAVVKVGDDGSVDTDAIKAALTDLAKAEDWMVAKPDGRPRGDADQGPRPPAGPQDTSPKGLITAGLAESTPK